MNWKRIDEMPCVMTVINRAQEQIKELTGTDVSLMIESLEVNNDPIKTMLQETICNYFRVTWAQIRSRTRSNEQRVLDARHAYMYIGMEVYEFEPVEVANDCGRDRTTALSAKKKIRHYYKTGDKFIKNIEAIKKILPND